MSERVIFDKQSAERIASAVKIVEARNQGGGKTGNRKAFGGEPIYLAKLTADVTYNSTVDVDLLEGAVGSEAAPGSGYTRVNAHNLLYRKLWSGSFCQIVWPDVVGSNGKWRIVWSDSASRLRGRADVAIAAGASGTVDGITLIDGRIGPGSSITAYNVLENFSVTDETLVWCEWNQPNARWEIYAADCAP